MLGLGSKDKDPTLTSPWAIEGVIRYLLFDSLYTCLSRKAYVA